MDIWVFLDYFKLEYFKFKILKMSQQTSNNDKYFLNEFP
jgi:hypothetical protein